MYVWDYDGTKTRTQGSLEAKIGEIIGIFLKKLLGRPGDDKSLDIVNDGKNDKLQLAKTGNFGGQVWKITPLGDGEYRLTSQWQVLSGVLNTFAYTRTICAPIAFKRVSIC